MKPKFIRAQLLTETTVKLRWLVDNLAAALVAWDSVRVHRADTVGGDYTPIGTAVDLVADGYEYEFTDSAGAGDKWYKLAFYKDPDDGDFTEPVAGNGGGNYLTIEQARTAGFTAAAWPDATVLRAIRDAEAYLEKKTALHFYPRYGKLRVDGTGAATLPLLVPIIAVDEINFKSSNSELGTLYSTATVEAIRVTNRHLTLDQTTSDDRDAPSLTYDVDYDHGARPLSTWPKGEQNIEIDGWTGYTELAVDDPVGETVANSQRPLSFGEPPRLIRRATLALLPRFLASFADPDEMEDATQRHRVIEWKSRHQTVKLQPLKGGGGITGDPHVDEWLETFEGPPRVEWF